VVNRYPPYRCVCYLYSLNAICPSSTNHDPPNSWETWATGRCWYRNQNMGNVFRVDIGATILRSFISDLGVLVYSPVVVTECDFNWLH
jgi:hypothetical protein